MSATRLSRWLFTPVESTPLVLFRMAFGFLVVAECAGSIVSGWVRLNLIEPTVHFPMIGFEWLRPLPGAWMYAWYALMALCGVLVMLGLFYRAAVLTFTLLWSGAYLMQSVSYNNHYYLLLLLAAILLVVPAHAWASLDARRDPRLASTPCPRWCVTLLQAQVAILYGFAALAKLDPDWLAARPLAQWLAARAGWSGGAVIAHPVTAYVVAWGGLLFDALIVPLLLWRRTRLPALVLAVAFHLTNSYLFRIGVFPYLALALCVLFFPGEALRRRFLPRKPPVPATPSRGPLAPRERLTLVALAAYLLLQLALPLRHHLYPGRVEWTEEGHRMAWRMMQRQKTGSARFEVLHPPTGQRWSVRAEEFLTPKQRERVAIRPDLMWQFAQFLERHCAARGLAPVEVHVSSSVSLNGRPPRALVAAEVDLAAIEWNLFGANRWIETLAEEGGAP